MKDNSDEFLETRYNRKMLMQKNRYLKEHGVKVKRVSSHEWVGTKDNEVVMRAKGTFAGYNIKILKKYQSISKRC